MSHPHSHSFDVASEEAFHRDVLEASHKAPIIVDFWAAWCGPCRALGPTLETLATEAQGRWTLAKVDIDQLPSLAGTYGVRSIPHVKAFHKGKEVDEFVGALPRPQIEAWLSKFVSGPADELISLGQTHIQAQRWDDAQQAFEQALEHKPHYPYAILGLALVHAAKGDADAAHAQLALLQHNDDDDIMSHVNQIKLRLASGDTDLDSLRKQVEAHPEDLESKLKLGQGLAANAQYEEAFQTFLAIFEITRTGHGEQAKDAMVQLFQVVGMHSPLTQTYRKELSRLMFS
jgi:putative thioredoxin